MKRFIYGMLAFVAILIPVVVNAEEEVKVAKIGLNYYRTYSVLDNGVTGGSVHDEGAVGKVSNNKYGFYVTYETNGSPNLDTSFPDKDDYCYFQNGGPLSQYDGTKLGGEDALIEVARYFPAGIQFKASICGHSNYQYWFYYENSGDMNAFDQDDECAQIVARTKANKHPTITVYHVSIIIPLTESTANYCTIWQNPDQSCDTFVQRNVDVYLDGVKLSRTVCIFPKKKMRTSDLNVNPATPYIKDRVEVTDSNTYSVYLLTPRYTIVFNGNGSTSGSMSNMQLYYNESKNLISNAFSRTGFSFTGWNTAADGSGISFGNCQLVSGLSTQNGAVITLYAQWGEGKSDFTVSITGLQSTDDNVIFSIEALSGNLSGKKFNLVLNSSKSSQTFKAFSNGDYKVTALGWSLSSDVMSNADNSKTYEQKNITGGYEFKFIASQKSNPLPHAEASVNNVWVKEK